MIKLTLDLTDSTTWAQLRKWVEAVDSTGSVDPDATIVRNNDVYTDVVRDRLEVEIL